MPTYVTLYKFTAQGVKDITDSPRRLDGGIKAFEAMGGKVLGAYYLMGEYDLVVIGQIPSEELGVAHSLAMNALGNVRSTTLRAFTPAEFSGILQKMP